MKTCRHKSSLLIVVLALVGLFACKQETPSDKAKSTGSGASAPVAGQDVIDAMKKPMDDARGTEGALEKASQQTTEKAKQATQ